MYNRMRARRWIAAFALLLFFLPAALVQAAALNTAIVAAQSLKSADIAAAGGQPAEAAASTIEETVDRVVVPQIAVVARQILLNLLSFVVNRLAYDAAVALSSAATGQTALVEFRTPEEYFKDVGLDIAGETIQSLNDILNKATNMDFGLCAPRNPYIKLGIQLGIKAQFTKNQFEPRCEFQDFVSNWQAVIGTFTDTEGGSQRILREFAQAYNPNQNELISTVTLYARINQQVFTEKYLLSASDRESGGYKDVVDFITGQRQTPASLIQRQTEANVVEIQNQETLQKGTIIGQDKDAIEAIFLQMGSIFVNTLLSNLASNIYSGLFKPRQASIDPFNPQIANIGGREQARQTFRGITSVPILSLDTYNPMDEFVVCPGADLRGQYNCVMDQQFANAITRARTGDPFTVQEAVDEGLLNGDWPLIPSDDDARNQDPFCHTYGYCYGNMVKLRKARILPIGWELAANSPFNDQASPVTLQEVVDGFYNCNDQGEADSSHKWCHLIDPNWVLKVPNAECRAFVPGELPASSMVNVRQSVCVDSPTCIAHDANGQCIGGYGYCTQEENVWQFRGDSCPAEYAGCLAFSNERTNETLSALLPTVNAQGCTADNAGCQWYRANRYYDDHGTEETADDTYEFLPTGEIYALTGAANRDDDIGTGSLNAPVSYTYDSDGAGPQPARSYTSYAYQDRAYFDGDVGLCTETAAGCTELIPALGVTLNLLGNPGFETDANTDLAPDVWNGGADDFTVSTTNAFNGQVAISPVTGPISVTQENILLSPSRFYTLSYYAKSLDASNSAIIVVELNPAPGPGAPASVNLAGTSVLGNCALSSAPNLIIGQPSAGEDFERFTCTFTTPSFATLATVQVLDTVSSIFNPSEIYLDAFQLELGTLATTFQEGYGSASPARTYVRVAPDWLGCTGAATDPAQCDNYTQQCNAQDVGCELYTPADGGLSVPAITSAADVCPAACVGYATYKQEPTSAESSAYPIRLIASSADICSVNDVGCDAYTNLDVVAAGGEGIEYYKELRACALPTQDAGATFYTWEGSDNTGYQLRTWQLIESNLGNTNTKYVEGSDTVSLEYNLGAAPCTNSTVISESDVACADLPRAVVEVDTYTDCNEHDDIFTNPDCREFYDATGGIHYRLYSKTATVSAACTPYRKDTIAGAGEDLVRVNQVTGEAIYAPDGVDDGQENCEYAGGLWTGGGSCRLFALPSENVACSASAAGCRLYTGSSARNAATVFTDTVEDGALTEYEGSANVTISAVSLATSGHSVHVTGSDILATLSLVEGGGGNPQCAEGVFCTLTGPGGSSCTVTGTAEDDVDDCGALVGDLTPGKTYILEFYAKGTGTLEAQFVEDHGNGNINGLGNIVTLTPEWSRYSVGPFDATIHDGFDDTAQLRLVPTGGGPADYYIDYIELKETEQNLALIKDSWETPALCDATPSGAPSPGYYLGCQTYADRAAVESNLYQFTRLCQEEVIGCRAYYDTQNSDVSFGQTFNATCALPAGYAGVCSNNPVKNCTIGSPLPIDCSSCVTGSAVSCEMNGETMCTIGIARDSCTFDYDGALPNPLPANISLGPEARVVANDLDIFLVDNGTTSCQAAAAGCTEVGLPAYRQDKSRVTGFAPAYLVDDPDRYDETLCSGEALFCEAWDTNEDGTFYFKDPGNQVCEFRTQVSIENQLYRGWFRTGGNEPCYYDDLNSNSQFDAATELATAYLITGIEFGVWRNGDTAYDGWVGACADQYDRCSEFEDPLQDVSYVFIKNEKIEDGTAGTGQRCNGQVSLDEGCALFFDTVQPELLWNASASYLASGYADILFGDAAQSLQSPISCLGAATDSDVGRITSPSGLEWNLCHQRCRYTPSETGATVEAAYAQAASGFIYTGSCIEDRDCPVVTDSTGESLEGTCRQNFAATATEPIPPYDAGAPTLNVNDVNDIRNVRRDRECAEWLACQSSHTVWDERTGRFKEVCDGVATCTEYTTSGSNTFCSETKETTPVTLTPERYVARDVSWWGTDYSGYSIPYALSAADLDQVNINPQRWCVDANGNGDILQSCTEATVDEDCDADETCEVAPDDMRLAFAAGLCEADTGQGEACRIGQCLTTGSACASSDQCPEDDTCLIGQCRATLLTSSCDDNNPCTSLVYPVCFNGQCTSPLTGSCVPEDETTLCGTDVPGSVDNSCVVAPETFTGNCYAGQCLIAPSGTAFVHNDPGSESTQCRGYPEQNAPYPHAVVTTWRDPVTDQTPNNLPTTPAGLVDAEDWTPYTKIPGFTGVEVCAPNGGNCLCTYQKVGFANGVEYRYYSQTSSDFLTGICQGGDLDGQACDTDIECDSNTSDTLQIGRCLKRTSVETMLGLPGYCLERDSSINQWGNPSNNGVCLSWYPVDQLSSSTDIYNSYTEAGFPLDDTFYCSDVGLYVDLFPTGSTSPQNLTSNSILPGCAETKRSGNGPECVANQYDGCQDNAHCPQGYFAVVGFCNDAELGQPDNCVAQASASDNDCPYFCVPYGARDNTVTDPDESTAKCAVPTGVTQGTAASIAGPPWDTDFFAVGNLSDDSGYGTWVDRYKTCTRRGVDVEDASYERLTPIGFISNAEGYFMANSDAYYYACREVAKVSQAPSVISTDGNKAWTNRLWEEGPAPLFAIQDSDAIPVDEQIAYTSAVGPTENGGQVEQARLVQAADGSFKTQNGNNELFPDQFPVPIAACRNGDLLYTPAGDGSCATPPSYPPPADVDARAYEYISASVPVTPTGAQPCTPTAGTPENQMDLSAECNPPAVATCDLDPVVCVVSCNDHQDGCQFNTDADPDIELDLGDCEAESSSSLNTFICEDPLPTTTTDCSAAGTGYTEAQLDETVFTQGVCTGSGSLSGMYCAGDASCYSRACIEITSGNDDQGYCSDVLGATPQVEVQPEVLDSADSFVNRLSQFFAKVLAYWRYDPGSGDDTGKYTDVTDTYATETDDVSAAPDPYGDGPNDGGEPPIVRGLDDCFASGCREADNDTVTVNGVNTGVILGTEGRAHVSAQFFVEANPNQMPVRNVIVNWGDGSIPSGSQSSSNYYKNHRGLLDDSETVSYCARPEGAANWGETSDACTEGYFTFSHDYVCFDSMLITLPNCDSTEDLSDGCTDGTQCIFIPRVHVKDNWGWCTGECGDEDGLADLNCYDGTGQGSYNECNIICDQYSSNFNCDAIVSPSAVDPWIYFDGEVRVEPD